MTWYRQHLDIPAPDRFRGSAPGRFPDAERSRLTTRAFRARDLRVVRLPGRDLRRQRPGPACGHRSPPWPAREAERHHTGDRHTRRGQQHRGPHTAGAGRVDPVLAVKGEREAWASTLDQLTLADFINSGGYDRHIRRMRQRYRQRRNLLVDTLAEHAPHITATGIAAGLHSVLRLPPGTERSTVKAAAWLGIALDGLATFRHPQATVLAEDALVVGYATPPDHAYRAALDALRRALPPQP